MYDGMPADAYTSLIVASPCHSFRRHCRAAFDDDLFPGLLFSEASSVPQLLLTAARTRQAVLLVDQRVAADALGDVVDMLHSGGFSGPVVAATDQAQAGRADFSGLGCLAHTVPRDASAHLLRQALAPFMGLSASMVATATPASSRNGDSLLPLWVQEKRIIEAAIRSCGGNVGQAARALEISPSTIYRKMQSWQTVA